MKKNIKNLTEISECNETSNEDFRLMNTLDKRSLSPSLENSMTKNEEVKFAQISKDSNTSYEQRKKSRKSKNYGNLQNKRMSKFQPNVLTPKGRRGSISQNIESKKKYDKSLNELKNRRHSKFKRDNDKFKEVQQLCIESPFEAGVPKLEKLDAEEKIRRAKLRIKVADTCAAIVAFSIGLITWIENEDFYNEKISDSGTILKDKNESSQAGTGLRIFLIPLTVLLDILIYMHYHTQLHVFKTLKLAYEDDNIYSAGMVPKLVLELVICSIFCPPKIDYSFSGESLGGEYEYSYNAMIGIICFSKSYLIFRLYGHYSKYTGEQAISVCRRAGSKANVQFGLKSELKHCPMAFLSIILAICTIYFGLSVRTFERPYKVDDEYNTNYDFIVNGIWLILITMTTVGYGDLYPSTHAGRSVGVVACFCGMILVSLAVVALSSFTEFDQHEARAYAILKKQNEKSISEDRAADVILQALRLNLQCKKFRKDPNKAGQGNIALNFISSSKTRKLKNAIVLMKKKEDSRLSQNKTISTDQLLKNLEVRLTEEFRELVAFGEKQELQILSDELEDLIDYQEDLNDRLDEVMELEEDISQQFFLLIKEISTEKSQNTKTTNSK